MKDNILQVKFNNLENNLENNINNPAARESKVFNTKFTKSSKKHKNL